MNKIILITGASSGFGRLTANALADAGHTVYASMRETKGRNAPQVADVAKYAKDHGVDLNAIELDVGSQPSVDAGVAAIIKKHGRLDVVMHNAGHMVFGPAESFTPEQLAELYDVNVLSTQRVNRAALPQMRKQKQGLLVWARCHRQGGGHAVRQTAVPGPYRSHPGRRRGHLCRDGPGARGNAAPGRSVRFACPCPADGELTDGGARIVPYARRLLCQGT